ncbi:MAG: hypothetical protein GEU81_12945 [Nitriliruptorales bacterium]|nr:hypothetical protein [Nitriliruptorales bacterium]
MVVVLDNPELQRLLPAQALLDAVRHAYVELGRGRAVNRPRTDLWMSDTANHRGDAGHMTAYVLKSFEGAVADLDVAALRLNSDIIEWTRNEAGLRKDKVPLVPGNRYNGLILLFSSRTGELLAMMPDGYIQGLRVAASTAVAAEQLSRADSKTVAVYGSGWQAQAALEMLRLVRSLEEVRVFSPNPRNRLAFSNEMSAKLGIPVRALDEPRAAAADADIVLAATNSVTPVVRREWIAAGGHVSCVKYLEFPPDLIADADPAIINTRMHAPVNYIMGQRDPVMAHDPTFDGEGSASDRLAPYVDAGLDFGHLPELTEVMAGTVVGRTSSSQTTCFLNNIGLGIQFAAAAKVAYDNAVAQGVGQRLPADMFSQTIHP